MFSHRFPEIARPGDFIICTNGYWRYIAKLVPDIDRRTIVARIPELIPDRSQCSTTREYRRKRDHAWRLMDMWVAKSIFYVGIELEVWFNGVFYPHVCQTYYDDLLCNEPKSSRPGNRVTNNNRFTVAANQLLQAVLAEQRDELNEIAQRAEV